MEVVTRVARQRHHITSLSEVVHTDHAPLVSSVHARIESHVYQIFDYLILLVFLVPNLFDF